ncbi:MAG TPA: taurine ABC transporter substrate-binding protein, partial [Gammaproteobacteria bacterium]|nr:taurine ABC transporter substrate-binding protein [Gammaproteobacteria bacterium]
MRFFKQTTMRVAALVIAGSLSSTVYAADQVSVAFFLEWATP